MKNDQTKRNKKKKKERKKGKEKSNVQAFSTKIQRNLVYSNSALHPRGRQKQDNVSSRKSSTVDPLKQTCENIPRHSASFIPRDGHRGGQN